MMYYVYDVSVSIDDRGNTRVDARCRAAVLRVATLRRVLFEMYGIPAQRAKVGRGMALIVRPHLVAYGHPSGRVAVVFHRARRCPSSASARILREWFPSRYIVAVTHDGFDEIPF
jgi:hypothetical protein